MLFYVRLCKANVPNVARFVMDGYNSLSFTSLSLLYRSLMFFTSRLFLLLNTF
jgi:hypothetical protein